MTTKHRSLVVVLLTAMMGACGGSADKGATTAIATTTAPVPSPATTAAPTDPAAAAKAKAAVLQASDFPAGFEPQPEEPGQGLGIEAVWNELTRCLGAGSTTPASGLASSPTFKRGLATQARATVEYTSESSVAAISTALDGPKFQGCAKDAFAADVKRSAPEGAVPGTVAVAPAAPSAAPAAAAGAKTYGYRVTVTLNLGELKVPLFQDFAVILNRNSVVRMMFLNPGSEFPPDLERSLVAKVTGRT